MKRPKCARDGTPKETAGFRSLLPCGAGAYALPLMERSACSTSRFVM